MGLVRILAQVTAIMVIPMVGGAVIGLVIDTTLGTSPLSVLIGLAIGTAISAVGIWLLIRAGARDGFGAGSPRHDG
ncbi:MAG: AtpZ/AtpI family protein [Candidatus Limnocylindria bacterium]